MPGQSSPTDTGIEEGLIATLSPFRPRLTHRQQLWMGCFLAVGSAFGILWLRLAMDHRLEGQPTFIIFTIPIMLSAYVGGLWPGLLATVVSCLAANYYLLPPIHSFSVASPVARWQEAFLILAGLVISALNEGLHRARQRAREGEELFAKSFRLSPDCVAIVRLADRIVVEANDGLCTLWGGERADIVGQAAAKFIVWRDEAERSAFLQQLTIAGECLNYEARLRVRDGRELDFSLSCRLITFAGESCVLSVMRDITERKRAEVATARLAAIVDSSADAIIGKSLASIITSWNTGAELLFGYRADEMIGQSILRLIPSERRAEEEEILEAVRQNRVVQHFETARLCKDGSVVDVSVTVSPIRDAAGRIVGASKVARNITDRKRAEAALRLSEGRYRALFDHAPDGILIADAQSTYLDANGCICRMLGYTHAELVGLHATDIVVPKEIPHIAPALEEIASSAGHHREWEFRRKDGSVFAAEVMATRMPDGNLLGVVRDITERKQAEQQIRLLNADLERRVRLRTAELEAANRELEAFSYSISHDLRAPLRAVDGFSQAALEDFGPQLPEDGRRQLRVIRESAQRMGNLIDDLLAFSRLSRQPLGKQPVDMAGLVRSVLGDFAAECETRRVEITLGDLPACAGDPSLLRQVLVNLVSNALKYSRKREHAQIAIGCQTAAQPPVYYVRDNGSGFDLRYAGKLFGVFQRLHRAEDYEGTGVGLAIVQRIVNRHGGRIWADSVPDGGATFFFTLESPPTP